MASNLNRHFHSHTFPSRTHCNYCICTIIHTGESIMQLFIGLFVCIFHGLFNVDICIYIFPCAWVTFRRPSFQLLLLNFDGIIWELRVSRFKGNIQTSDFFVISVTSYECLLLHQPQFTFSKLSLTSFYQRPVHFLDSFPTLSLASQPLSSASLLLVALRSTDPCISDLHASQTSINLFSQHLY